MEGTPVGSSAKDDPADVARDGFEALMAGKKGNERVEVTDVPDPAILEPNDIIIRVTSTAICGSDLHLYGVLGPFLKPGDVLGHEPMGIVEETGPDIANLRAGDRVVVPFNISCGHC